MSIGGSLELDIPPSTLPQANAWGNLSSTFVQIHKDSFFKDLFIFRASLCCINSKLELNSSSSPTKKTVLKALVNTVNFIDDSIVEIEEGVCIASS